MGIPARKKRLSFLAFRLLTRDAVALANELKTAASPGEPDDGSHSLAAGEIVTTGTLTRALPVSGGETWTTELTGVALDGVCVRFTRAFIA